MLNKKGLSLVELIVCIVLIGIILLFVFQLLGEVQNETESNNFVYNNQLNRTDASYKVARELNQKNANVSSIKLLNSDANTLFDFEISYDKVSNKPRLKIIKEGNKYYIDYNDYDGNNNRWEMKSAKIDSCGEYLIKRIDDIFYFKLNIYVYNIMDHKLNNAEVNNVVDDLEIVLTGDVNTLNNDANNLLMKENGYHQIGVCAN